VSLNSSKPLIIPRFRRNANSVTCFKIIFYDRCWCPKTPSFTKA